MFQRAFLSIMVLGSFLLPILAFASSTIESNEKYASIVIDAKTYEILHEVNADKPRYPASLTKLMTLYLTFNEIRNKQLYLGQMIKVSERAADQWETKLGLKEGELISVEDCIRGLIVRSANDCAVVLADAIADTEFYFAIKMSKMAKKLDLDNTRFTNAHGLPDRRQKTTAQDIAKLALALKRDFPEYYHYFGETEYLFHDKLFYSHNNITKCYEGAQGMKTGFINDSGYNIVSTVTRDGKDVLAIVLGGETGLQRDKHMVEILNKYFPPTSRSYWANLSPVKPEFTSTCDALAHVDEKG